MGVVLMSRCSRREMALCFNLVFSFSRFFSVHDLCLLLVLFSDTLFLSSSSCLAFYIHTYIHHRLSAHCIHRTVIHPTVLFHLRYWHGVLISSHTYFISPSLPWWLILTYILFDYVLAAFWSPLVLVTVDCMAILFDFLHTLVHIYIAFSFMVSINQFYILYTDLSMHITTNQTPYNKPFPY